MDRCLEPIHGVRVNNKIEEAEVICLCLLLIFGKVAMKRRISYEGKGI